MTEKTPVTGCGRGEDLVSFLYGEATEREARDFETHLEQCISCRSEFAGFGQVHQSMIEWRDETFAGFVSSAVPTPVRTKSAIAALREFFDLSPLWLKGAVGFAVLTLCALAFLNASRGVTPQGIPSPALSDAKYTEKQLQDRLEQARVEWVAAQPKPEAPQEVVQNKVPDQPRVAVKQTTPHPKGRRPLSRSEREQLAAHLGLRSTDDDDLTLLGDRINKEF
jgi:hypothetical protein